MPPRAREGSLALKGIGTRMRVIHCIYDDPANPWVGGGGAVRVRELYRRLKDAVAVTVLTGNYPRARSETRDGIAYVHAGARGPYALSRLTYARAARRYLERTAYDAAVFDFSAYTPILVPTHRPVGITVHHLTTPTATARWGPLLGSGLARFEHAMLRRAVRLSATSSATHDLLRPLVDPAVKIDLVYAGVPDELFALRRKPENGLLLYFGRLDILQKGLDTLLQATALLVAGDPRIELHIAGRGKDGPALRQIATSLGLRDHVVFRGAVSEKERQRLFSRAAVQMMPSRFEGFGMVAAEAMAAGVPLVASTAGSLPEVVSPPAGGILVPPEDPQALASAVARLLSDPQRRSRLSETARASAKRFLWDEVAQDHLGFLRGIAADHLLRRTTPST